MLVSLKIQFVIYNWEIIKKAVNMSWTVKKKKKTFFLVLVISI